MMKGSGWLRQHAEELGINANNVNPASVDLTVGIDIKRLEYVDGKLEYNLAEVDQDEKGNFVTLIAGFHYLVATAEVLQIPEDCAAIVRLKSSLGRGGVHLTGADFYDPGYRGNGTVAMSPMASYKLYLGQKFVQIMFHEVAEIDTSYEGQYQNSSGAVGDLGAK